MIAVGTLVLAALFIVAGLPLVLDTPAAKAEASYWDRFKSIFIDWDDNAEPGAAHTEVTGVRGVDVEEALGDDDYDWAAVGYMENVSVSVNEEKAFLEEGGLGPFRKR